MNILYTNFHNGYGGGHDTYIMTLLENRENRAYVACPESSDLYNKLKNKSFPGLIPLDFPGKIKEFSGIINSVIKLTAVIRDNNIDVVHTNGSSDNRLALYARILGGLRFKIVFTRHNSFPVKGIISKIRIVKFNDAIIFVSQSIYNTSRLRCNEGKISVIRNGVDTEKWRPSENKSTEGKLVLTSIAGTSEYKGWHYLIKALKLLPEDVRKRFLIRIAGKNPSADTLNRLCDGDWLPEIVLFSGLLSNPEEALAGADIGFVLSDSVETISFACREMMASGLPVIVSNYGGLPENVSPGVDGWIVPAGDVRALTDTLSEISCITPDTLSGMKANARAKAKQEFSVKRMIDETNRVYRSVRPDNLSQISG